MTVLELVQKVLEECPNLDANIYLQEVIELPYGGREYVDFRIAGMSSNDSDHGLFIKVEKLN